MTARTARSLKAVDARLRVGGPATAQVAWVGDFIRHVTAEHVPADFVSSHIYGDDTSQDIFGVPGNIPRNRMVCLGVEKVHKEIQASAQPSLPFILSEFNASWGNHREVTDAPYMGPWLGETIRQCDGLVQDMSYWTFSDVFEEQGVVKTPFHGGFGLRAVGGIPKPAFNAFALMHQLGEERLPLAAEGTLLTRRRNGALVLALWNYAEPGATVAARRVVLEFRHVAAQRVELQSMDDTHANVMTAYQSMGAPQYPTQQQIAELRRAGALAPAVERALEGGTLTLEIPSDGLTIVTVPAPR